MSDCLIFNLFTSLDCVVVFAAVAMTFLIMEWTDLIVPCIVGSKFDPAVNHY